MSDAEEEELGASGGGGHRISPPHQQAMQEGRAKSAQRKRQRQERMQGNTFRRGVGAVEAVEQDMSAQHMADMRGLLEAALGERTRGAPVDIMRACMALGAYYIASDAERLPFEPRDLLEGERVALACSVSSLSKNTVRKLVSDFEFWGEIVLEEPGTRGAGAEAYSRWARLVAGPAGAPPHPPSRFDPTGLKRPELVAAMQAAGCTELEVSHRQQERQKKGEEAQPVTYKLLKVTMDDAEKVKRGGNDSARLDELRAACIKWLASNRPHVLRNDLEEMLAQAGNVRVIWNAANFPEGTPIELVWAGGKLYVMVKYDGKRTMSGLRADLIDGLYSDKLADEVAGNVRGCSYAYQPQGNPNSKRLIDHCLRDGLVKAMKDDSFFDACNQDIRHAQFANYLDAGFKAFALLEGNYMRTCLHLNLKERLLRDLGAEAAENVAQDMEEFEEGEEQD